MPYRVEFENDPTATAPAQRVVVTDPLNPNIDWNTLQFTEVGFGDHIITVPAGSQHFLTTVPMTYNGTTFNVVIELAFDSSTGLITATFQSINPVDNLPPNILTGFLPPEDGTGRGKGYFSYRALPKPGLPTGRQIRNVATVTFDINPPITTDQVDENDPSKGVDPNKQDLNTIDATPPSSSVSPLPAVTKSPFLVQWSGQDDPGGSGISDFSIYVSDNGGPFTLWLQGTTLTQAYFRGQAGHRYAFFSFAQDNAGNLEPLHTTADAQTTVTSGLAAEFVATPSVTSTVAGTSFSLTVAARDIFGIPVTSFTGKVHFASSDKQAVLPADYTFTSSDQGMHTFTVTLKTAGSQRITVTSALPGLSAEFTLPTAASAPQAIVTGPDNNLWFTDEAANQIGHITPGGAITEFAIPTAGSQPVGITKGPDGNVWFTEAQGNAIGRITTAGVVTEFALPNAGSRPWTITTGPEGNLWFTEYGGDRIGRITPAGVVTEFTLTGGSQPYGIVTGSDLNLWFTESGRNRLGRMTTAGTLMEFAVPTAGSQPEGIVSGPDKNLWFTEFAGSRIGQITTTGILKEFSLPNAGSQPATVVTGPNNNLWFTESGLNQIGQITKTGVITEFPVLTSGSQPLGITSGPDKNLWFTEAQAGAIGRMTPLTTVSNQAVVIDEFPTPTTTSNPQGITVGPDKNVWFTDPSANQIGKISTGGTIIEFAVPTTNSAPFYITTGSDKNLWFTEETGNKIGRLAMTGTFTEFALPTANSNPLGITSGPDKNLWFTEFGANRIGRITPTGTLTEFALGAGTQPFAITAGPDGNLWFTEAGTSRIGRITTGGIVTEFSLPTGSQPEGIVLGPDKNIWFTEFGRNRIGKITTGGLVTEFLILTPGSQPVAIVTGPDKNLWFTESRGNQIGQITTKGVISQFPVHIANSQPTGIATGPDGNLWFTQAQAGQIGRLTTAIKVSPAAASVLVVSGFPSPTAAGAAHNFTVTVKDAYGNIVTSYTGTVHFTSSDSQATLPADYTFKAADKGKHTFSATLRTLGTQSITVTDTVVSSITGTESGIAVVLAPLALSPVAASQVDQATTAADLNFLETPEELDSERAASPLLAGMYLFNLGTSGELSLRSDYQQQGDSPVAWQADLIAVAADWLSGSDFSGRTGHLLNDGNSLFSRVARPTIDEQDEFWSTNAGGAVLAKPPLPANMAGGMRGCSLK